MYPLDLPVFAIPPLPGPAEGLPQPLSAGIVAPHPEFADALAGLMDLLAGPVVAAQADPPSDSGTELPEAEQPSGNSLPGALSQAAAPELLPPPMMTILTGHAAHSPPPVEQAAQPQLAQSQLAPQPAFPQPVMPLTDPVQAPHTESAGTPSSAPKAQEGAALLAEMLALPPRTGETLSTPLALRDAPTAAVPPGASAPPSASLSTPPAPGAQLEQLVEALAQAREAGKGARGDIAVRHGEFGLLAIRLEADGGETRAQITARDPGFAPAVVAALAERAHTGAADQQPHQRGQDQSWGQQAAAHGDPRQHERRQGSAEARAMQGHAPTEPAPSEPDQPHRTDPHGRFA